MTLGAVSGDGDARGRFTAGDLVRYAGVTVRTSAGTPSRACYRLSAAVAAGTGCTTPGRWRGWSWCGPCGRWALNCRSSCWRNGAPRLRPGSASWTAAWRLERTASRNSETLRCRRRPMTCPARHRRRASPAKAGTGARESSPAHPARTWPGATCRPLPCHCSRRAPARAAVTSPMPDPGPGRASVEDPQKYLLIACTDLLTDLLVEGAVTVP